jgi:hypothetical protein
MRPEQASNGLFPWKRRDDDKECDCDDDEINVKTAPQVWQKNLKQFLRKFIYRKV